jgi:multidrug resistance protein
MAKLIVLFVTAFVDMVGLAIVLPLLPYYATDFGANATTVGILVSAFSVAQLACAPIWGRFSDRYGRRPAILVGLLITAVAYVVFAFSNSVLLLLISRVVQGLGGGTIGVVQAYVADASPPKDRTKSLGWLSAVTSLGAVVGPALGSLMVVVGGQAGPGLTAAALAALVAGFAWRFLREAHVESVTGEHHPPTAKSELAAIGRVFRHSGDPAPRLIWIYTIAIGAFYGTVPIMPLLLVERLGITERTVGYVIMYLGGMGVLVRALILGKIVDRLGEARLSRLGIVLLAAGLAVMAATRSHAVLVVSLTLMPLGTAFLFPCVTGLLSRVISSRERGLYMGVQHTFGGLSRVVFPLGAGVAMDHLGMGVPFVIAGILVFLTLPLTREMAGYSTEAEQPKPTAERLSAADITAEIPVRPEE